MARLVIKTREVTEDKIECEPSSTTYGLPGYPEGRVNQVTMWVGESYINLSRGEMLKLRNIFDKLLK